uniref:Serine protease K12H4.7 n=1 Tax=Ciona savignyi TaxID=51511 RepID=H2Y479_CIOSA
QRLDNFNGGDDRVWNQRYFANDQFSASTGPVFLNIGGEGPASHAWMTEGHWVTMAQQTKAMLFQIEHRFYGDSHPTHDASIENLSFLSSEQALADIANFITNITATYKLHGRKWIVFGGSYSGALSVWARFKYPHLISGAISASAPLQPLMNFYQYQEVVQTSLTTLGSPTCAKNVLTASDAITTLLKSESGCKILSSHFKLCSPLSESVNDQFWFQESVANNIQEVVQYNRDNNEFEGGKGRFNITHICKIMDDESLGGPLERYAELNTQTLKEMNITCLDSSFKKFISDTKSTSWDKATGMRQWTYQTCAEFGWFQTTDSKNQPFHGFPLKLSLEICEEVFGIGAEQLNRGIQRSLENYGGVAIAGLVTNVTLYNGKIDPWSAVSYPTLTSVGIRSIVVPDTAHCAIMYPASPHDSQYLKQARLEVERELKAWLGL